MGRGHSQTTDTGENWSSHEKVCEHSLTFFE